MLRQPANMLRALLLTAVLGLLLGCGSDKTTGVLNTEIAPLVGSWKLDIVTTVATGPVQASPAQYDAMLTVGKYANTFSMIEWNNGVQSASSGIMSVEGDHLRLIHTEDYQTAGRVDDAMYSIRDGTLTLALGKEEWRVLVFERQ